MPLNFFNGAIMASFCGRIGSGIRDWCWPPKAPIGSPGEVLLDEDSRVDDVPEELQPKRGNLCVKTTLALATAGCFVARGFNINRYLNGIATVLGGIGFQASLWAIFPNQVNTVNTVSRCVFNTLTTTVIEGFFYSNADELFKQKSIETEETSTSLNMVAWGVQLAIVAYFMKENWRIIAETKRLEASTRPIRRTLSRTETPTVATSTAKFAQPFWAKRSVANLLDVVGTVGSAVGAKVYENDPLIQTVLKFFSLYYGSHLVGDHLGHFLDKKIEPGQESKWRYLRIFFQNSNTLTFLLFYPFRTKTFTDKWRSEVWGRASFLGVLRGIRTANSRLIQKNIPIIEQAKFKKNFSENPCADYTKIVFALAQSGAWVGFLIWQIGFDGNEGIQVTTLSAMLGTYLATIPLGLGAMAWNRESSIQAKDNPDQIPLAKRTLVRLQDEAIQFLANPSLLHVDPVTFYALITTTVAMDSAQLSVAPASHGNLIVAAYVAKTFAQALEAMNSWGPFPIADGEVPQVGNLDNGLTLLRVVYQDVP